MKQLLTKRFAMAAFLLCAVPGTSLLAQQKEKEKTKEKTERQQIVITRTGDKSEKTVIEIDGDKVKVNGKDVADLKDIQVRVNNLRLPNAMTFRNVPGAGGNFSMSFDDRGNHLFSVDSNRAMLGVMTEGHDKGAEIQSVSKESAAEKAGLKKGDVLVKIDNRKIDETDDVTDAIQAHKPGDKVTITYLRDGKEQKTTAELGRWKGINMKSMTVPRVLSENMWRENQKDRTYENVYPSIQGGAFLPSRGPRLGLSVQDTDDGKGVKVLDLDDDGTAGKAGVKENDVITHVDDKAVNSADEISKMIREKKDQPSIRLQVLRAGKSQNIEVKIPRKIKTVDL